MNNIIKMINIKEFSPFSTQILQVLHYQTMPWSWAKPTWDKSGFLAILVLKKNWGKIQKKENREEDKSKEKKKWKKIKNIYEENLFYFIWFTLKVKKENKYN